MRDAAPVLRPSEVITLSTSDGPVDVEAVVFGALAVHQAYDNPKAWVVTHVPTGLATACFDSSELAHEFRAQVAELLDWPAAIPGQVPRAKADAVLEVRARLGGSAHGRVLR